MFNKASNTVKGDTMKLNIIYYLKMLKHFRQFMNDVETKMSKKFLVLSLLIISIIYLFTPIDIVPDLIPILGFTEDAAVILSVFTIVGKIIGKEYFNVESKMESDQVKDKAIDVDFEDMD